MRVQSDLFLYTSAREPRVWVCVNKQLHLEQIPDFLRVEHEDALKQDHVGRVHRNKLLFPGTTHRKKLPFLCGWREKQQLEIDYKTRAQRQKKPMFLSGQELVYENTVLWETTILGGAEETGSGQRKEETLTWNE